MKKKFAAIILAILSLGIFVGCNSESQQKNEVREIKIMIPDGLPAIGASELIKNHKEIDGYSLNYSIEKTPENIVTGVLKGEPDIAIVPSNVAATQFNKNVGYKIAATTGWGSFYLISTDGTKDIKNLEGKEIYNIGKGLTPDIVTKTVLSELGYDVEKDFDFSYLNGVSELAPSILAGKVKYAIIPEPALAQVKSKKDVTVIMNLNEEWKKLNDTEYGFPQATVIVKKDIIEKDQMFLEDFLKNLKNSIEYVNSNPEDLGKICEEIGVSANKAIVPKSIENANLKYVPIKDSIKEYNSYFDVLNRFDPKTVGGKVPSEEIYMEK